MIKNHKAKLLDLMSGGFFFTLILGD